jgi:hypothetical protein
MPMISVRVLVGSSVAHLGVREQIIVDAEAR